MMSTEIEPKHLPKATGPFIPGVIDVMTDYGKMGLFMRLYYPTRATKDNPKKWIPWVQDDKYLQGISDVIMIPYYFVCSAVKWFYGRCYIPAIYGEQVRTEEKLKCIIMSHGLGGCRFFYSTSLCDLASYGFLVLSLEHKDQSASCTYYYDSKIDAKNDIKKAIEFKHIPLGPNHYTERNKQIKLKADECSRVIDFLVMLNEGTVPDDVIKYVPMKHEINFDLKQLVGAIDLDGLCIMGHSFGAATALYASSLRKEVKSVIALDPWMFPIKAEDLHEKINQSVLFINTQTFHIESNVNAMAKFYTDRHKEREMYTLCHSTHENQTDTVYIFGYWLNWFMRKIEPEIALRINNYLILDFLHRHMGYPKNIEAQKKYLEEHKEDYLSGLTKPWA